MRKIMQNRRKATTTRFVKKFTYFNSDRNILMHNINYLYRSIVAIWRKFFSRHQFPIHFLTIYPNKKNMYFIFFASLTFFVLWHMIWKSPCSNHYKQLLLWKLIAYLLYLLSNSLGMKFAIKPQTKRWFTNISRQYNMFIKFRTFITLLLLQT